MLEPPTTIRHPVHMTRNADPTGAPQPGPFAFLSRRRFLAAGLGGIAAVAGVGAGATRWVRGPVPPVDGLQVLSPPAYRTLALVVDATLGSDAFDVASLDLPRAFDAFLVDEHPANVRDLTRALTLIELGPMLFDDHRTTFARLDPDERAAHWAGWATSERLVQRQVSVAFRKFLNMVFYDNEAVWPLIGYPGPSMWELMGGRPEGR